MRTAADDLCIWTVGHSNREADALLDLLRAEQIELLADVRRFPGSKRQPQFRQESLQHELAAAGIGYQHFVDLGGRRSARLPDSPNTAWRVESFNAYADHMQTPEFQAALDELIAAARQQRTAIMCSEAVPWRCHRRLIADALLARGWAVLDILGPGRIQKHALTDFARIQDGQVTYPGGTLF
jgi:uncharacterized protein (DUF488 family)